MKEICVIREIYRIILTSGNLIYDPISLCNSLTANNFSFEIGHCVLLLFKLVSEGSHTVALPVISIFIIEKSSYSLALGFLDGK